MNDATAAGPPQGADARRQMVADEEHLKLLSLGYVISAVMTVFWSLFGLFYAAMGAVFVKMIASQKAAGGTGQPPPAFFGWMFGAFGLAMFVFAAVMAILKFRTASCLKRRKSRTFCMVVAGISCIEVPYGTVLGVFTFIVLGRESVMRLFESNAPPEPAN